MSLTGYSRILALFILLTIRSVPLQAESATLDRTLSLQGNMDREAAALQKKIDRLDDQSARMFEEYRNVLHSLESLKTYNQHLDKLIVAQKQEITSLDQQIDTIDSTNRDVIPLMLRMIDTLDQFVSLDVPFLPQERRQRVIQLKSLMERADITTSDKFRRILEAYQIETEYGRTIEAYKGELETSARKRSVEFLRIGRLALYYQSLDGKESGMWDQATRSWQSLPDEYLASIKKGIRIANKQTAPDLLTLPVQAPEVVQ